MRSRPLSVAGACAAVLVLGACSSSTGGSASPAVPASAGLPSGDGVVDEVAGNVRLPGEEPPDGRPALLAAGPAGNAVAFLRQLSDEGGDLSTVLALGLVTQDTDGGAPAEELPDALSEEQVPAVDDPVLVDVAGDTTVVVGDVGEPGDDVRFGLLRLDGGDPTAVLVDSPALLDADHVSADLSPDGEVLYLLAQTGEDLPVLLAVDPADGTVLAEVEVASPTGEDLVARGVAADPGGGVVTLVDVSVPGGGDATTSVLARWDAGLETVGEALELAPDADSSTAHEVAVLDDGTAVAAVAAGPLSRQELRLVASTGDIVTTVAELPDAMDPGGLAVDPDGGSAYLAVRERGTWVPTLVVADLGAGTTAAVELCAVGSVDDVAAGGGVVWVSGVCDDDAVVWAVR